MTPEAEVAGYIARWRPSSVPPQAAGFARDVVRAAGPGDKERAKSLLAAASRLAAWAAGLGLDLVPGTLLHPSVIERFARTAPGLVAGVSEKRCEGVVGQGQCPRSRG